MVIVGLCVVLEKPSLLAAWSEVLLEKPVGPQLVKKFSNFMERTVFTTARYFYFS